MEIAFDDRNGRNILEFDKLEGISRWQQGNRHNVEPTGLENVLFDE